MKKKPKLLPDAEYLRSILQYDAGTGIFTWQKRENMSRIWNARFAGKVAGGLCGGYIGICVDWNRYYAHRLAWLLQTGDEPVAEIDHIDCNRLNNRFSNLRAATSSQNKGNTRPPRDNISGVKGVRWDRKRKYWLAQIRINKKSIYLGRFSTITAASAAYRDAAIKHFAEFARVE